MHKLVIVESPAKAKTISRFLGPGYRVEASLGHVRDLPAGRKDLPEEYRGFKWADFAVNIDDQFQPIYVVPDEKKKHIANLKAALKGADELLLATDEDREGESISWHLSEVLAPKVPVRRIVFHEITREAIEEAIAHPRDIDQDLVRAQEARRVLDRLFGYTLSPVLWRRIQPGLSAGRVQSAAVRLLVEREEERAAFRNSVYWDLEAAIAAPSSPSGSAFKATLVSIGGKRLATGKDFDPNTGLLSNDKVYHLASEEKAGQVLDRLRGVLPWQVTKVDEAPASARPYAPFTTSSLQQEANRKLGFTARRTMQVAQKLYEGVDLGGGEREGLITYMRTDSVNLAEKALRDAQQVIQAIYGEEYAKGPRQYKTKTRNAQEAHEAIRPSEIVKRPSDVAPYLSKEELALYDLIWKRTVASQMPDARYMRTSVEITAHGEKGDAIFSATGKRIMFPGFLRAYVEGSDDPAADLGDQEVILPDMRVGQQVAAKQARSGDQLSLEALDAKRHETLPPARYTEASLVKKLEEEGIGRPSTYATILSTIMDRGYSFLGKSRQLVPTFTAMGVITMLRDYFPRYVDLKFTALMEEELDEVAGGKLPWVEQVRAFYRGNGKSEGLEKDVAAIQGTLTRPEIAIGTDPESGEAVRVLMGKFGPYLACGSGPGGGMADLPPDTAPADFTLDEALRLLRNKAEGPRRFGDDPATGMPILGFSGRYGAYVQLGETPKDKKADKPRRASIANGTTLESLTLAEALRLLSLPCELGVQPESGKLVVVNKGKFGPYVVCGDETRSLTPEDDPYTLTLERALHLLSQPKQQRKFGASRSALHDLGEGVKIMEGRFGPYVTDGKTNATVPRSAAPESLTLEQAKQLLEAKAAQGPPVKKGRAGARAAATKQASEKPAKKAPAAKKTASGAKKPAAKKPAAKIPAARKPAVKKQNAP